jgi:hypothetical protein
LPQSRRHAGAGRVITRQRVMYVLILDRGAVVIQVEREETDEAPVRTLGFFGYVLMPLSCADADAGRAAWVIGDASGDDFVPVLSC